ncbi:MAG: DUF4861 domain-containing protein [Bacteroidales bacterium]|nr:DUF4861 domain-containing protein [Bacteroidales bacterium]
MSWNFLKTAVAACAVAAIVLSCSQNGYKVVVSNELAIDRVEETVEVPLSELAGVPVESLVVLNAAGEQVPYQVHTAPCGAELLLFQVTVGPNAKAVYHVVEGEPEGYATCAYSRYVPERFDDYAYENNVIAGRIYGPALEFPRTYGADVWVKCTERLVIDEWFAKADYHHNYGEGMDCYKVDNTLGGGAWAPVNSAFEVVMGDNYASYTHVCDGPIRTEAVFEYDAVDVDGQAVSAKRIMSLDANSHFIKNVFEFSHEGGPLTVALAAVKHDVSEVYAEDNWLAFTEPASDTDDPERDGDISIGLVYVPYPGADYAALESIGSCHAGIVEYGTPDVYVGYTGTGWSQGGIESAEAWRDLVSDFALTVLHPLKVVVK